MNKSGDLRHAIVVDQNLGITTQSLRDVLRHLDRLNPDANHCAGLGAMDNFKVLPCRLFPGLVQGLEFPSPTA